MVKNVSNGSLDLHVFENCVSSNHPSDHESGSKCSLFILIFILPWSTKVQCDYLITSQNEGWLCKQTDLKHSLSRRVRLLSDLVSDSSSSLSQLSSASCFFSSISLALSRYLWQSLPACVSSFCHRENTTLFDREHSTIWYRMQHCSMEITAVQ